MTIRRRRVFGGLAPTAPVEDLDDQADPHVLDIARLVGALAAMPDGVVIVDADGQEVVRNEAAERYRDGRHTDALVHEAVTDVLTSALFGEPATRELALFGPPREALRVLGFPIAVHGERLGAVAIVRDVAELRRVESMRRDFVANVSHELKTPIGAVELLAETLAGGEDLTVMHQLAGQLVLESERLARIVDDLLDLSIIESQETPTRERVLVRALVEEAVERVRALALARGTPIRVEPIAPELRLDCDPGQIQAALTNLLDNAVKYSEPGAAVEVAARRSGSRVELRVTDRGIGIPTRDLERVFERFFRVDRARSRSTGGTGLGLAIVRHVAAAHGGEVTVESREGEGSTFRMVLPVEVRGAEG